MGSLEESWKGNLKFTRNHSSTSKEIDNCLRTSKILMRAWGLTVEFYINVKVESSGNQGTNFPSPGNPRLFKLARNIWSHFTKLLTDLTMTIKPSGIFMNKILLSGNNSRPEEWSNAWSVVAGSATSSRSPTLIELSLLPRRKSRNLPGNWLRLRVGNFNCRKVWPWKRPIV